MKIIKTSNFIKQSEEDYTECPHCGNGDIIMGKDDKLKCSNCGKEIEY